MLFAFIKATYEKILMLCKNNFEISIYFENTNVDWNRNNFECSIYFVNANADWTLNEREYFCSYVKSKNNVKHANIPRL